MSPYREVTPGDKPFKRAYVAVMLWFVGRAIQSAARVDRAVRAEFDALPEGFTFCLGVEPRGPYMVVGKNSKEKVKYLGWNPEGRELNLSMRIRNLEAAILLFTFQENDALSACRNRIIVDGDIPAACAMMRVIDIVEVYLLPKIIARMAIKRYPAWSFRRKYLGRIRIYIRSVLGY